MQPDIFSPMVSVSFVALLMALLWLSGRISLAVTALIPLFAFPLLGVMSAAEVSKSYCNSVIILFFGGFVLSIALQKWNLHEYLAYKIISFLGIRPHKLMISFILSTAFLSMWLSNTAAAVLMVSIASSVFDELDKHLIYAETKEHFAKGLMLAVAYSASIGGMATLIGTPPNMILRQVYFETTGENISFFKWMLITMPLVLCLLLIVSVILVWRFCPRISQKIKLPKFIDLKQVNKELCFEQKTVLVFFLLVIVTWLLRPVWTATLPWASLIDDSTVVLFFVFLLFLIPGKKTTILEWEDLRDFPWQIIVLFGGGFALADALSKVGLAEQFTNALTKFGSIDYPLLILIIIVAIKFFSELASNTAIAQISFPLLTAMATAYNLDPLHILLPAALSASCPFMLPVSTPPNAVVYATGKISIQDMWHLGLVLNLITVAIIFAYVQLLWL